LSFSVIYLVLVVESFVDLKSYFSQLGQQNEETGRTYCSIILAQTKPFQEIMDRTLSSLCNHNIGIYLKACDHKNTSDVGWLLYSARQQDEERPTHMLSSLTNEILGVKWKQVHTTEGFCKPSADDPKVKIFALHIEGPTDKAHDIRQKLPQWYSSSSTSFPDLIKMRLIPPFNTIISREHKANFATLTSHQEELTKRLATTTSWEFATNLLLDKPSPKKVHSDNYL
jgi:hypothetical protein